MSKWKAGQLVTIKGKVFQVTELKPRGIECIFCGFFRYLGNTYPCDNCCNGELIPDNCYFKDITECGKQDNL